MTDAIMNSREYNDKLNIGVSCFTDYPLVMAVDLMQTTTLS